MTINILHIMQSLEVGGMENGVVNIVNSIDNNFNSKIYCTKKIGNLAKKLDDPSAIIFEGGFKGIANSTLRLIVYCYKNKPDIIHSHGWGTLISSFIVSKLLNIKLIHGEHGTVYFERKKDVFFQKLMLNRTSLNLFVSKSLSDIFRQKIASRAPNEVIYNGVDANKFRPLARKKSNRILLGTVGRLIALKNHLWLIEVLSDVLDEDIHLMIVGSGALESDLIKKVKVMGMEDVVTIYGESSSPEVLMNEFDIFILPSILEGLSNTILEAMSSGLPIIASNVGGNSELIQNDLNGYLYELNNSDEFLEKINLLTSDSEIRKKFADASRRIVLEKFKLNTMISHYQNAYENVMRK